MATANFFVPTDMSQSQGPSSSANVTQHSDTQITIVDGATTTVLTGQFTYPSSTDVEGTITEIQTSSGGNPTSDISGLSLDAHTAQTDIANNQYQQLIQTALAGNDTINGSGGNDVLLGYDGNDTITGNGGNDTIDGGAGDNTATFSGTAAQYSFTVTGSTVKVTDTVSGRDGVDTLTNIEHLQFSDITINLPTVTFITAQTDNHNSTVNAGHVITFTLKLSEAMTVIGTPTLQLNVNEVAIYSSGSGTNSLTFTYTVQPQDNTGDLRITGLNLPAGAKIQDANGITLMGSVTFDLGLHIDNTPPAVLISSVGGVTNQPMQTVSGTVGLVDFGTTVTVFDGATAIGTATVQSNGSWSTNVSLTGDGAHTLTAQDTDVTGNTGTSSAVIYTLDTKSPTISTIIGAADTNSNHANAGHVVTVTVTSSEPVTVTGAPVLQLNDNEQAAYVGGSGTSTLTFAYTVQPGDNVADLKVTGLNLPSGAAIRDAAGNNLTGGAAADLGLLIDTTSPVVVIGSAGGLTNQSTQTLSGTVGVEDAGTILTLYDNGIAIGTATVQSDGSWSRSVTLTPDGIHTLTAKDTDTAGNTGTSNAVIYTVDTQPHTTSPTVSSLSAATDTGANHVNAGHLVVITVTATAPVTVTGTPTLQLNDGKVAAYTIGSGTSTLTFTYVVQAGDNTADLHVTGLNLPAGSSIADADGNPLSGPVSSDLHIAVDTTTVVPTTVETELMGLYAALYNRAGEAGGYAFWVSQVAAQPDGAGVTVANSATTPITQHDALVLGQGFVISQSTFFNATYGSLSDSAFINAMYVNIGGNAGDPGGLNFWSGLLQSAENSGQSVQDARAGLVGQFVQILSGFDTNNRPAGLTDQQWTDAILRTETIDNKIATSIGYFLASEQSSGAFLNPAAVNDPAYLAAIRAIQGVTSDGLTAAQAISNIAHAVAAHDLTLIQPVGVVHDPAS